MRALAYLCHVILWWSAIGAAARADEQDGIPKPLPTRAYLVADGDRFSIEPLGERAVVTADGMFSELSAQGLVAGSPLAKLPRPAKPRFLFGTWPDAVWLLSDANSSGQSNDLYLWRAGRWQPMGTLAPRSVLLNLLPLATGGVLAAFSDDSPKGFGLVPIATSVAFAPPLPARATREGCRTKLSPVAVSGLSSGFIVAAGKACETGDAAVEIWLPNQKRGKFQLLPPPKNQDRVRAKDPARARIHERIVPADVYARAPDDVYVVGTKDVEEMPGTGHASYLAHYDGKVWTTLPVPRHLWPQKITGTPDGWLFVVGFRFPGERLWRRSPAGDWQTIDFDPPEIPGGWANSGHVPQLIDSIWVRSAEDFWVALRYTQIDCGDCFHYSALYHSLPPVEKLHLPRKTPGGVVREKLPGGGIASSRPAETPTALPQIEDMDSVYREVRASARKRCAPGHNKFSLRLFWGWTTYIPNFPYRIYISADCVLTGMTDERGALLHRGVMGGDYCLEIGGNYSFIYSVPENLPDPPPPMMLELRDRRDHGLGLPDSDAKFRKHCAERMRKP